MTMRRWIPALFLIPAFLAGPAAAKTKSTAKSSAKPEAKPKVTAPAKPAAKETPAPGKAAAAPPPPSLPPLHVDRGTLRDPRDGATYKTITVGKQTWMAQNLDFAADGSMCYENRKEKCDQFGRLYDWHTAKKACPSGWHLPKDEEWTALLKFLAGGDSAGRMLKSTSGWSTNGNGIDRIGFDAIAAGNSDKTGIFNNMEFAATFWSSTKKFMGEPLYRRLRFDETSVERETSDPGYLYSVRCVKDGL